MQGKERRSNGDLGIGKVSQCMFSANTGNELRVQVQTLAVDLCVLCEAKGLEIVLLNDIPVIFDITLFISM
jgi:hypothetical protein